VGGDVICHAGLFDNPGADAPVFERARIAGTLFLNRLSFAPKGAIDLVDAQVSQLVDDRASWPGKGELKLEGFAYGTLAGSSPVDAGGRIEWLNLQPGGTSPQQPFQQLAKVLRDKGYENKAREILIALEEAKNVPLGWRKRLGTRLYKSIGYGYKPQLAIRYGILLLIAGWLVVSLARQAGVMTFVKEEPESTANSAYQEDLSPLTYSLDTLVPVVNLHQREDWWPDDRVVGYLHVPVLNWKLPCPGWLVRVYLWLHILMGWVIAALVGAGLTGIVRRE
jgi:hypothetical protein